MEILKILSNLKFQYNNYYFRKKNIMRKIRKNQEPEVALDVTKEMLSITIHRICDFGSVSKEEIIEITETNSTTAEFIMERIVSDKLANRHGYSDVLHKNHNSCYNYYDKSSNENKSLIMGWCGNIISAIGAL